MPLKVVCFCSYFAARHTAWRGEDWNSYKFIQALKGRTLNGYAHVPVNGLLRRLSNQNLNSAIDWFAQFAAGQLDSLAIEEPFALIPIPNSNCTSSASRPTTLKLARAIQARLGKRVQVIDCLRWKRNLGSASKEGGPRDPATLYTNLVITERLPAGVNIVLVDDVLTSGGHLVACAARLRKVRSNVVIAVCGGRTTYSQDRPAFEVVEEELPDYDA